MQRDAGATPDRPVKPASRAARLQEAATLAIRYGRFAGTRGLLAAALLTAGAALEGAGLLLLAPLLALITDPAAAPANTPHWAAMIRAWSLRLSPHAPAIALLAAFACLTVARAAVVVLRDRTLAILQFGFTESLRTGLVRRLGASPWAALGRLSHARVSYVLGAAVERCGGAAFALLQICASLVLLMAGAGVAVALSPPLALMTLAILALAVGLAWPALGRVRALGRDLGTATEALLHKLDGFFGGLKLTLSHGRAAEFVDGFEASSQQVAASRIGFATARSRAGAWSQLTLAAAAGAIILIGSSWLALTPAFLLAFLILTARLAGPAQQAQRAVLDLLSELPAYGDVVALDAALGAEPSISTRPTSARPGPVGAIRFEGVSFRHPGGGGVRDVDLTLRAGEFVGLAGPSGAGKTTLADLLAGLILPQSGVVSVGGRRLEGADRLAWQSVLSYAPQDPFLFHQSLRANLLWASPGADEAALWEALDQAEAAGFVRSLPEGLDSVLGERGVLVSGGERQRIALARALLRQPAVLILDEALNALDPETENRIVHTLEALEPRPTILMIAHRMRSLSRCERVLELVDGQLEPAFRQSQQVAAG